MKDITDLNNFRIPFTQRAISEDTKILNRRHRILVIDDDQTLQIIFTKLLAKISSNIQLNWATSAEDFLMRQSTNSLPGREKYDLVITDIHMPGDASGFDIWRYFSNSYPHTPVVMMSGISKEDFYKSMGGGAKLPQYLEKPLNLADCRRMVEGVLLRGAAQ